MAVLLLLIIRLVSHVEGRVRQPMQSLSFAAQANDLSGQMFVESRLMQFLQEGSAAVDDNLSSGPTHLQDSHLESLLLLCTLTQNHNPRRSRLQRFHAGPSVAAQFGTTARHPEELAARAP